MSPVVQAPTLAAGRTAFGAGAAGDAVFTAATQAAARTALGAGAAGANVFTAATQANARAALGAGATGDAAFTAATPAAAQTALEVNSRSLDNLNASVAAFCQYQIFQRRLYTLPRTASAQMDFTRYLVPDNVVSANQTWTSANPKLYGIWVNSGAFTIRLPAVGNGAGEDPVGTIRYLRVRVNPVNSLTLRNNADTTTIATVSNNVTKWLKLRASGTTWVVDYNGDGIIYSKDTAPWVFYGASSMIAAGGGYPDNLYNRFPTSRNGAEVRLKTTAKEFFLFHKDIGANWRVMVNGEIVGGWNNANTGGLWYRFLEFPDNAEKEIVFTGDGSRYFGEIVTLDGTVTAGTPAPAFKAAFITDSIGEGAENSYGWTFAKLLGFNVINSPEGGSGFIQTGNRGTNFIGRIATEIYPEAPGLIVVQGGRNDAAASNAAFQAAIEALCDDINTNLPGAVKILMAPFSASDAENISLAPRGEIVRAVAAAKGFFYIDNIGWIKGTRAVAGSGNATKYIQVDNVHMNDLGRGYFGTRLVHDYFRIVTGELYPVE